MRGAAALLFAIAVGGCSESTGDVSQVSGGPTSPDPASDAGAHADGSAAGDAAARGSSLPTCDDVRSVDLPPMVPAGSGSCDDPFVVTEPGAWELTLGPGSPLISGAADICSFPRTAAVVRLSVALESGELLWFWQTQPEFQGYPQGIGDCAQVASTLCQSPEIDAWFGDEGGYLPEELPTTLLLQAKSELLEPASVTLRFALCKE